MKVNVASFFVGVLFAIGLGVSGMTQPSKVIQFLDIFGAWDPSLAFVMIGALLVAVPMYALIRKNPKPLLAPKFQVPETREVTAKLSIGAALFGLGWGLSGYCPAPALVSLTSLAWQPLAFVAAMIVGMLAARLVFD